MILGFDTSGPHLAAALAVSGKVVLRRAEAMAKGQAEALMPFLEGLLTEAGIHWRDLDAVAVGTGPGNFTGIRISVAAARGLSLGLGCPAVGVSGFECAAPEAGAALVCLPAPRDSFYIQPFTDGTATAAPRHVMTAADIPADMAALPAIGPAADRAGGTVQAASAPEDLAAQIVTSAAQRTGGQDPLPRPAPVYARPADAAPARDAGPKILP